MAFFREGREEAKRSNTVSCLNGWASLFPGFCKCPDLDLGNFEVLRNCIMAQRFISSHWDRSMHLLLIFSRGYFDNYRMAIIDGFQIQAGLIPDFYSIPLLQ